MFRALRLFIRLFLCGKRFATTQSLIFALIIPHTSFYVICHCLIDGSEYIARSNATSSHKTLPLFSANFAFRILLCVWFAIFIHRGGEKKRSQNQQNFQCSRRPTASSQQSATNQHGLCDVICNALWLKQ